MKGRLGRGEGAASHNFTIHQLISKKHPYNVKVLHAFWWWVHYL